MKVWLNLFVLAWTLPAQADQTLFGPIRNGAPFVRADLADVGAATKARSATDPRLLERAQRRQ